jgi:putative membrane protein
MVDRKFPMAAMAALLLVVLISPAFSQTNPQHSQSGATTMMNMNPAIKLAEANYAEIELGKLAQGKAENSRVKEFADMMVKDHTEGLDKVRAADSSIPTNMKMNAKHQMTYDRLSKLSGAEFDRQYMTAMTMDHQADVRFLEQLSGQGKSGKTGTSGMQRQKPADMSANADAANVAQELLPTVKHHLQMAQEIQKELQKTPRK